MGKIEKILKKGPVEGQTTEVYPVTSTKAVYDENNKRLDNIITGLQESIYLNNTPIDISFEDTPEANAQNAKNIADYIKKAKAAGVDTTLPFKVFLLLDGHPTEGIYDTYYSCIYSLRITDDGFAYIYTLDGETGKIWQDHEIVTKNSEQKVTSSMRGEGARRPIILTPDTTEVDEETYQKLLPDGLPTSDVDIMFRIGEYDTGEFIPCISSTIHDAEGYMELYFAGISYRRTLQGSFPILIGYYVTIGTGTPHQCEVTQLQYKSLNDILSDAGYLNKSTLNPVLEEIDLSGTDADRKANLDKFEADWKALTGASDLSGARVVGYVDNEPGLEKSVLFTYNYSNNYWSGIYYGTDGAICVILDSATGNMQVQPLFSHLEAITIQTLNIPANKKKNSDAIQAYVNNLESIGVDVTKGYTIPIKTVGFEDGVGVIYPNVDKSYKGICIANGHSYIITISKDGTWNKQNLLDTESDYTILNTSTKSILGAINEINTLANNKQDTLTSGTNIKTINNQSLLGSGNIEISAPSITVDTTMSDTSTNPVQNKVIKAYIDGLVGNVATQLAQI